MSIHDGLDFYKLRTKVDELYGISLQVYKLQKEFTFIKGELDYLLATLSLECNRERLRKGEGLEQVFGLVDVTIERITNYNNQKGE